MSGSIRRIFDLFINSLCYLRHRNVLVVSAYVEVRKGNVVHRNWGDDINVFLLEKISGAKVIVKNQSLFHIMIKAPSFLSIGSTVGFMMDESSTVWGAGAMYPYKSLPCVPRQVLAVRGPLTRKVFMDAGIECPEVYGDPALLVSRYYRPEVRKQYRLGIVVHYTDEDNRMLMSWLAKHEDVLLIRMGHYDRWEDIPDGICSCEEIWSSSLHGMIVSDSYSVPNRWVRFKGNISGGDFKYKDYMLSVGRDFGVSILETETQMDELLADGVTQTKAVIDSERLLASCPFLCNQ